MPNTLADLTKVRFEHHFRLTGGILPEVLLARAKFEKSPNFERSFFAKVASFVGVTFEDLVSFQSCFFAGNVDFGEAKFLGNADFKNTTFQGKVRFEIATFAEGADFYETSFGDLADFRAVKFEGGIDLFRAKFDGPVDFERGEFGGQAIFSRAVFRDLVVFDYAEFQSYGASSSGCANFYHAQFDGSLSLQNTKFIAQWPLLDGVTVGKSTVVSAEPEFWPTKPLNILARLDQALGLRRKSDLIPALDTTGMKASAAWLRNAMAKQSLPEQEHFFFRQEMYAAARNSSKAAGWLARIIFEFLSDYGHSISRPAFGLLTLLLLGMLLFAVSTDFGWGEALGFSFANMFKFFGLTRTYFDLDAIRSWSPWLKWAGGAQTVLSFVFLFFLGLGLRTRFRLR